MFCGIMLLLSEKRGIFVRYYLDPKDEEKKSTYITDVEADKRKGVYCITYANGEYENNVVLDSENKALIEDRLQKQVKEGIENLPVLKQKQKRGYIRRIITTAVAGGATGLGFWYFTEDPMVVAVAAGVVAVGGMLYSIKKKQEQQQVINELRKYQYRQEHESGARNYLENSPNAYRCFGGETENDQLSRTDQVFDLLVKKENPFSLLSYELGTGITTQEYKKLVKSARREEQLGFSYKGGYGYQQYENQFNNGNS